MELSVPLIDTFFFLDESTAKERKIRRIPAEDVDKNDSKKVFHVTFRQGTQTEDLERTSWMNRRKYGYDQRISNFVEISDLNPDDLARLEVSLTLSDTDLKFPGGKPLRFNTADDVTRVADPNQFHVWWGMFPSQWAAQVYSCCLEVNPDWAPKR